MVTTQDPARRDFETGELTNGTYTVDPDAQAVHTTGDWVASGKSQFAYSVDADALVLRAAEYADANNLWRFNRAKVEVLDGFVGVTGNGGPTRYVNVFRRANGRIHGSPGNPPRR